MKPHIKEKRLKEVRQIYKRINELCTERRNLGYIELDKPVRHGWYKEIIIIQNVERYKNQEEIFELYKMVNKRFWGRTKEEADKKWFHQISKHLIYRDFPTISRKQYNKLSEKAQAMCTPFQYRTERKKLRVRFYIRIPKGAYRIRYKRAYFTKVKIIDPLLESELDRLDQRLERREYYKISPYYNSYRWWDDVQHRESEKRRVKQQLKALRNCPIEDIIQEKIKWERN